MSKNRYKLVIIIAGALVFSVVSDSPYAEILRAFGGLVLLVIVAEVI